MLVRRAQEGDVAAAKLLLDRCIPARKAVEHFSKQSSEITIVVKGIEPRNQIEGQYQPLPDKPKH